jgi:hypothetical protein
MTKKNYDNKTIGIDAKVYDVMNEYCKKRGIKIKYFVETAIMKYIEKIEKKKAGGNENNNN